MTTLAWIAFAAGIIIGLVTVLAICAAWVAGAIDAAAEDYDG